jgi:hypothetical protein
MKRFGEHIAICRERTSKTHEMDTCLFDSSDKDKDRRADPMHGPRASMFVIRIVAVDP